MSASPTVARPSLWQSAFEFRALFEVMSLLPARPMLDLAPKGEGQPVLVFPGFYAADRSTARMRAYLNRRGYDAYAWEQGRNPGLSEALYQRLEEKLLALYEQRQQSVSLVGWSLGGLYARLLAHKYPDKVRQVITLGSPFNVSQMGAVSGAVERLYERMNPDQAGDPLLQQEEFWKTPPPVPSTAIYSEGDGIAHWSYCIDAENHNTENIQVPSSHLGMTHNPLILYMIATRLSQPEGEWRPFQLLRHLGELAAPWRRRRAR